MSGLFPYPPRDGQLSMVDAIRAAVEEEKAVVIEAATGTGKTVSALAGILDITLDRGLKVLYSTRTNAQQKQVISELREVSKLRPVRAIALQGRRNLCLLAVDDMELKSSTPEEHTLLCADRKKAAIREARLARERESALEATIEEEVTEAEARVGLADLLMSDDRPSREKRKQEASIKRRGIKPCGYFAGLLDHDVNELADWVWSVHPTAEEFSAECHDRGICAYEAAKRLIPEADVTIVPYNFAFHPFMRRRMESMMGTLDTIVLVVDEAHNLPGFARDLASASLSMASLDRCDAEARSAKDPLLAEETNAVKFIAVLREIIQDLVEEYVYEDDGALPPYEVGTELMSRLGVTSLRIGDMLTDLHRHGSAIRDAKRAAGRLPRSYLFNLSNFLSFWREMMEEDYMQLVIGGPNPAMMIVPSPFPSKNIRVGFVNDVTTRYEEIRFDQDNRARMMNYLLSWLGNVDRSSAVFFPSYRLMNEFLDSGLTARVKRPMFVERQGMSQAEFMTLLNKYKRACPGPDAADRVPVCDTGGAPGTGPTTKRPILFGVMGGRVGEGMDFPGEQLEMVVIVGLPYPKPTARQRALQHYYDIKFGRGFEYTVHAPAGRKVRQAIGRLIRSEEDRGVAMILDKRANHFVKDIPGLRMSADPMAELTTFWRKGAK
jgi:DNA excision repair protein ERCC-2